jgi:glyoxylase-like metal-dependent hydrolase (beta-lactamase superfamily II)
MTDAPVDRSGGSKPPEESPAYHRVVMPDHVLSRRLFLADMGKGAFAVAVLGIAACSPSGSLPSQAASASTGPSSPREPSRSAPGSAPAGSPAPSGAPGSPGSVAPGATTWTRVNLGFVSAYLLVRGGEAAIVDTGVAGSEDEIAAGLTTIGLDWSAVGHVILTHKHPDHAGSISAILAAAPAATGYIGTADLPAVQAPRPLTAVNDGDSIFGLTIIATPGHTIGHVAVLDEAAGVLVAGDALGTRGGPLTGSNPQFTEDATAAQATVVKLGKLRFETLLVGHGEPILGGAAAQVAALGG